MNTINNNPSMSPENTGCIAIEKIKEYIADKEFDSFMTVLDTWSEGNFEEKDKYFFMAFKALCLLIDNHAALSDVQMQALGFALKLLQDENND